MINKYLFINLKGGLGNQLFIFFSVFFLKKKIIFLTKFYLNPQRIITDQKYYRKLEIKNFPSISKNIFVIPNIIQKIIYLLFKLLSNNIFFRNLVYIEKEVKIKNNFLKKNYLFIDSQLLNYNFFLNYRNEIKKLIFVEENKNNLIINKFSKYKKNNKSLVMLHIRRGDMIQTKNPVVGLNYYKRAMKRFSRMNVKFLIFTDSPSWCLRQKIFKRIDIVKENDPIKALLMMKLCDHFIISNSTFSWWAAFLGEKNKSKVFYPSPFISPTLTSQLILDNWVPINY
jgi:hypothetical protein